MKVLSPKTCPESPTFSWSEPKSILGRHQYSDFTCSLTTEDSLDDPSNSGLYPNQSFRVETNLASKICTSEPMFYLSVSDAASAQGSASKDSTSRANHM